MFECNPACAITAVGDRPECVGTLRFLGPHEFRPVSNLPSVDPHNEWETGACVLGNMRSGRSFVNDRHAVFSTWNLDHCGAPHTAGRAARSLWHGVCGD